MARVLVIGVGDGRGGDGGFGPAAVRDLDGTLPPDVIVVTAEDAGAELRTELAGGWDGVVVVTACDHGAEPGTLSEHDLAPGEDTGIPGLGPAPAPGRVIDCQPASVGGPRLSPPVAGAVPVAHGLVREAVAAVSDGAPRVGAPQQEHRKEDGMSTTTPTTPRPDLDELSLSELVSHLSDQTTRLVRQEVELAKAELAEKGKPLGIGAGSLVVALVVLLFGLGALTACFIIALDIVVPAWAAALITFGFWALTAAVLALVGRRKLQQASPPVPERTVETVKDDITVLKASAKDGRA